MAQQGLKGHKFVTGPVLHNFRVLLTLKA